MRFHGVHRGAFHEIPVEGAAEARVHFDQLGSAAPHALLKGRALRPVATQ
ncbi:hypothetical protein [Natronohydrobacter thiooxidans]|nr:hypothetical protein [Natronohydrobacter thiooxidans]